MGVPSAQFVAHRPGTPNLGRVNIEPNVNTNGEVRPEKGEL